MTDSLRMTTLFSGVSPGDLYRSWLDGETHGAMTGGAATSQKKVGEAFTAWDGYISGRTLELERDARILQAWRTSEFPDGAPDSLLEIAFEEEAGGTRVTIVHTVVPPTQVDSYTSGWEAHYFVPMRRYFASRTATAAGTPAAKHAAPAKAAPAKAKAAPKKPAKAKAAPKKKPAKAKAAPKKKAAKRKAAPKKKAAKRKAAPKKKARRGKGRGRR